MQTSQIKSSVLHKKWDNVVLFNDLASNEIQWKHWFHSVYVDMPWTWRPALHAVGTTAELPVKSQGKSCCTTWLATSLPDATSSRNRCSGCRAAASRVFNQQKNVWEVSSNKVTNARIDLNKPLSFQFLCVRDGVNVPQPTNASRLRNEINPWNYLRKSNQQPHSLAANSNRSSVDDKVLDSSTWLLLMHWVREEYYASTSLRQFWSMHFILKLKNAVRGIPAGRRDGLFVNSLIKSSAL